MVEARPGIAFIEFDSDMQSSAALHGLQVRCGRVGGCFALHSCIACICIRQGQMCHVTCNHMYWARPVASSGIQPSGVLCSAAGRMRLAVRPGGAVHGAVACMQASCMLLWARLIGLRVPLRHNGATYEENPHGAAGRVRSAGQAWGTAACGWAGLQDPARAHWGDRSTLIVVLYVHCHTIAAIRLSDVLCLQGFKITPTHSMNISFAKQ